MLRLYDFLACVSKGGYTLNERCNERYVVRCDECEHYVRQRSIRDRFTYKAVHQRKHAHDIEGNIYSLVRHCRVHIVNFVYSEERE